jgi:sphinganine C4-monooxygenase
MCDIFLFEKGDVRWWYLLIGIWLVDTVEYILHYSMHYFPILYRNIHSTHHQIRNSYNYAALYQSATEALIETVFLMVFFWIFCFRFEEFMIVMALGVVATVFDHTGVNTFHSIHHSSHPNCNFQQPFFTYYDHLFGTYYKKQKMIERNVSND